MELILSRLPEVSIEANLLELIDEWKDEVLWLDFKDESGWSDGNKAIAESQYAYIKFGLILEKIRNSCAYKYSVDKLKTFAQFCKEKLKLTVWQANSYIDAADTAIYLSNCGFNILPKNYSQATVLAKAKKAETDEYHGHPKLQDVWVEVISSNAPEKITATSIEKVLDPQYEEKQSLKLPKHLLDRAKIQAKAKGMTVEEYLGELMDYDAEPPETAQQTAPSIEVTDEMIRSLDELELTWKKPVEKKIEKPQRVNATVEGFDNFMDYLVGRFLPKRTC